MIEDAHGVSEAGEAFSWTFGERRKGPLLYCKQVPQMEQNGSQSNDPRFNFYANPTLDEIIAQQGKGPVTDVSALRGDFWPDDEPVEDFIAALHEWRGHTQSSKTDPAA